MANAYEGMKQYVDGLFNQVQEPELKLAKSKTKVIQTLVTTENGQKPIVKLKLTARDHNNECIFFNGESLQQIISHKDKIVISMKRKKKQITEI